MSVDLTCQSLAELTKKKKKKNSAQMFLGYLHSDHTKSLKKNPTQGNRSEIVGTIEPLNIFILTFFFSEG